MHCNLILKVLSTQFWKMAFPIIINMHTGYGLYYICQTIMCVRLSENIPKLGNNNKYEYSVIRHRSFPALTRDNLEMFKKMPTTARTMFFIISLQITNPF